MVLADGSLVAFPADLPRCTVAARLGDYVVLTSIAGAGTDTRMLDVATRSWSALPFAIKPTEPIAMATIGGRLVFNQPLRRSGDPPEVPNSS